VVWKTTKMVHLSIFPFKIDRNPLKHHMATFKMRHVATLSFYLFFIFLILRLFNFFLKNKIIGVAGLGVVRPPPHRPTLTIFIIF
jgi:hypothetical protein